MTALKPKPPPIWQLKISRGERFGCLYAFIFVTLMYVVWTLDNSVTALSLLIAFAAWIGFSLVIILQWRSDSHHDYEMEQRKLQKFDKCPTCNGDGWVPK